MEGADDRGARGSLDRGGAPGQPDQGSPGCGRQPIRPPGGGMRSEDPGGGDGGLCPSKGIDQDKGRAYPGLHSREIQDPHRCEGDEAQR